MINVAVNLLIKRKQVSRIWRYSQASNYEFCLKTGSQRGIALSSYFPNIAERWQNFVSNCSISKVLHVEISPHGPWRKPIETQESRIPPVQASKYKCSANKVNVFIEGTTYDMLPVLFASSLVSECCGLAIIESRTLIIHGSSRLFERRSRLPLLLSLLSIALSTNCRIAADAPRELSSDR